MKITGSISVAASRQKVWDALNDPTVLGKCLPGCEKLERTGEDEFTVSQNIGVAGIKGRYQGKIALQDKEPPSSCTLRMEGQGPGGFLRGSSRIKLTEKGGTTELAYDAEVQIGGLLASLGSRLVEPVSKQLIHQFYQSLEKQLKS